MKTSNNERAAQALKRRRAAIYALRDSTENDRGQLERQLADDTRSPDAPLVKVLERLSDDEQNEIAEIDAALDRIKRGEYGRCESCGGAVGGQRLAALPETRYCVECAERTEREKSQRAN